MKAHELLSDPDRFVYRAYAVNRLGKNVLADSREAIQWDAPGAIQKCYGPNTPGQKESWTRANDLARNRYSKPLCKLEHPEALELLKELDI